jgi:two-component system cell cycle response regulator
MENQITISDYGALFDHFQEGIYFVDPNRRILYFNKAAEIITGFHRQDVIGTCCYQNVFNHLSETGVRLCFNGCPLQDSIERKVVNSATVYLHHRDGQRVKVSVRTLPVMDEQTVTGALEIFSVVTEESVLKETLSYYKTKLMTDPLTEVNNRNILERELPDLINRSRADITFGVLFLDIDNFKKINDTYGHDTGDRVLRTLSKTLSNSIRSGDIIIRYGGEEFVIVLHDIDEKSLAVIAEKIRFMVENSEIRMEKEEIRFTISIGATLLASIDSLTSAIDRADQAMYCSKQAGKNRVTLSRLSLK